jgi:hypothetical protein
MREPTHFRLFAAVRSHPYTSPAMRSNMFAKIAFCLTTILLMLGFQAAPASAPATRPSSSLPQPPTTAPAQPLLQRVVMIGASATYGFGATLKIDRPVVKDKITAVSNVAVNFGEVMEAMLRVPHDPVTTHANLYFFSNPMDIGPQLIQRAKLRKPTLVVALDFLFWFGYGDGNRERKPITSEDERLALLEEGLRLLEQLDCPVIVGDFGDMSKAVGGMLTPQQMPARETLDRLNARLREWCKAHPRVIVAPLAKIVEQMGEDKGFAIGSRQWPAGCAASVLQRDELHPTVEGLIALAHLVADVLAQHGLAEDDGNFESDPAKVLALLRQRAEQRIEAKASR